jgi:hypothetical protein
LKICFEFKFDWKKFIVDGVFKGIADVYIPDDETIIITELSYLINATKTFSDALAENKR